MKKKMLLLNDKTLSVLSANLMTSGDPIGDIQKSRKNIKKLLKDVIVLNGCKLYTKIGFFL